MIIRVICFFLFIHFTFSTMNNKKSSSMSFPRRRLLDERFRRQTRLCEQHDLCQPKPSLPSPAAQELLEIETLNCIRRCISSTCYKQIYAVDPLERGEIDQRAKPFQTCWIKEQKD